ncbi:hypothetical protein QR680_005307 [Steinernema hermaphroditum]|uniref:Uncharacterized protein n=1 Tax=Steinernema hermaphroditum TaxID=289476 RepID=A0AA39HTS1_9BILA|nr:hypothetical protein QR680_005307 [Steinernema hermaphroditum]
MSITDVLSVASSSSAKSSSESPQADADVDDEKSAPTPPAIAVDKLEPVVFTALFGYQAIPIRLKILLDYLISGVKPLEADRILRKALWTLEDFSRGYANVVSRRGLARILSLPAAISLGKIAVDVIIIHLIIESASFSTPVSPTPRFPEGLSSTTSIPSASPLS